VKKFVFCALLLLSFSPICLESQAQVQTVVRPRYSSLWRNINRQEIREGIQRYKNNGVRLHELMMRALLQEKFLEYLTEISAACKADPKKANLFASYGQALALSRSGSLTQRQPIPKELSDRFNFNQQFIWDTIQHARDLDRSCWLADMAEASLSFGGLMGHPTEGARLTGRAYSIQQNAVTMTQYGIELTGQSFVMQDPEMKKQALSILLKAQRLYPTYWKLPWALAYVYGGKGPTLNPAKEKTAAQRFIALIPPESRNLPWVRRYLNYLGMDKVADLS